MAIYQVIQNPEWACPGMVIWTQTYGANEFVTAMQQNPENGLTYQSFDEDEEYRFDPTEYAYIEEVIGGAINIKSVAEIKANYEKSKTQS